MAVNASNKVRYEPGNRQNQTLDNFGAAPGIYGVHGGPNQQWDLLPSNPFPLLAGLSGADVQLLRDLGL